jgi:MFS family permease
MSSLGPTLVEDSKGSILHDLDLSTFLQQLATGVMIFAGMLGSLFSSGPVAKFGPRRVLIFCCFCWIIGGSLCVIVSIPAIMIGRFIAGIALGVSSAVVPVYLSEIAVDSNRGIVTSLFQLILTIGILIAGLISYGLVEYVKQGWRPLLAGTAVLGFIGLVTHPFMLDSPAYLVHSGRDVEAKRTIALLRGKAVPADLNLNSVHGGHMGSGPVFDVDVEAEYAALHAIVEHEKTLPVLSWSEVFSQANRRALIIGFGLMFFQPLSGINAVIIYSSKIFKFAGLEQAILGTVLVGIINVIMTIVSMSLVERAGRRVLLLVGTIICTLALAALATTLLTMHDKGDTASSGSDVAGYIAVVCVLVYIVGFAVGMGAVCWVVMSEVMLPRVRTKAYALFIAENWALNLVIAMTTLSAIDGLGGGSSDDQQRHGVSWLFVIFGGVCAIAIAFMAKFIPETKGMTTAAIDDLINGRTTSNAGRPRSSSGLHSELLGA